MRTTTNGFPICLPPIAALEPSALIGVSGQPRTFTRRVIEAMTAINDRPLVFALSNPTEKSECTAEEAYTWSGGGDIRQRQSLPAGRLRGPDLHPTAGQQRLHLSRRRAWCHRLRGAPRHRRDVRNRRSNAGGDGQ